MNSRLSYLYHYLQCAKNLSIKTQFNNCYFNRGRKNDEEVVAEKCHEILSMLPLKVSASFEKGKHLTFEEAIEKLKERLGKHLNECNQTNITKY